VAIVFLLLQFGPYRPERESRGGGLEISVGFLAV
jgi:hypothetical protein